MAPEVQVPMNFGRHHIGSPSHSNLLLKLKEGEELRANSLILSFNSRVIEHLTTELHQTSLEMDDFSKPAVECFIDAMYTGELELISKPTFRDVNKMGSVFDVCWLVAKCGEYFQTLTENVAGESYDEMLFVFEEGRYVLDVMKKRDFIEIVFKRINLVNGKAGFIGKYMKDFGNLSNKQLDLMVQLAGNEVEIVVQSLTSHLSKHVEVQGGVLAANSRYLLETSNLSLCRHNDRMIFENLFDILHGMTNKSYDEMSWLFGLLRKSTQETDYSSVKNALALSTRIPNLFHSLGRFGGLSFTELIDRLADDVEVTSLLMFAEALYTWMINKAGEQPTCSPGLLDRIVEIKRKRLWRTVPKECFQSMIYHDWVETFYTEWAECDLLSGNQQHSHIISCHNPDQIIGETLIIGYKNNAMFYFKHPDTTNCPKEGKCGFMLKITPSTKENPDLFDIKLCTDHKEYNSGDIHFHHDLIRAENMHFILERLYDGLWESVPVSWYGKPVLVTGRWRWKKLSASYQFRIKMLYFSKDIKHDN